MMIVSKLRLIIAYSLLWIVHIAATFILFPSLNISCVIPVILIVGIGAWSFGTTAGLYVTFLSLVHNFILTGVVYADLIDQYQYILTGYLLLPTIAYLVGHLRFNLDALKKTNHQLDHLVAQRTYELDQLTEKLLENSENMKNARGQKLHDGIGQQLTGIQLISSSLSEHLLIENNSNAALAHRIQNMASKTHQHVRVISRMLFPVRIPNVGLPSALKELASILKEIKGVLLYINDPTPTSKTLDYAALQIYRIFQEVCLHAADHHLVSRIDAVFELRANALDLNISYLSKTSPILIPELIQYRAAKIGGTLKTRIENNGRIHFIVSMPSGTHAMQTELSH